MNNILTTLTITALLFSSLNAKSYADYLAEIKGKTPVKQNTSIGFNFFTQPTTVKKSNPIYTPKTKVSNTHLEKKFDKQIRDVKNDVKEIKKEVKIMSKAVQNSNEDLIKEVKKIKITNTKKLIPVATIKQQKESFLTIGFGYQGLSVKDENGYFGEYALDDTAIDIKATYGQYFNTSTAKLFATGGFEYLSLKQADMKAITTSINTETEINENVIGYIGLKTGLSYLVWDIPQNEAIESITSTSPLIGIQVGIEYKFDGGISLVLGGEYTKYFHETQIPLDTLKTNSAYGVNISLKFYQ